jgi:hypothetical protein
MSRLYGDYGPVTCTCSATVPVCPACRAYKVRYLQPGGMREPEAEEKADGPDPGRPQVAQCGSCEELFPIRREQIGPLTRGLAVYCGNACRKVQRRTADQQLRARRKGRG